jgi:23S rRNA pseudouridine1911/1915/1917 synthase
VVHRLVVGREGDGERLDKYLAARLPQVSRSRLQRWIEQQAVRLNGAAARSRATVFAGDRIEVRERELPQSAAFVPEPMALDIVWEDEAILVVNKPAGLVVHPGAGNWSGTLLNGLLAHDPRLSGVPRAGIVHRLDAGTSGLLVVARTPQAQWDLVQQLAARSVVREYWAVVAGAVAPSVTVSSAIERDPRNPLRFRTGRSASARPARTYIRLLAQWDAARLLAPGTASGAARPVPVSWVACRLDTGRTHQIRVHLESIGHPLLGDPVYWRHMPAALLGQSWIERPALHACRLELRHPVSHEAMAWSCAPPADMARLMRLLGARAQQLRAPARLSIELPAGARARGPDAGETQEVDEDEDDD